MSDLPAHVDINEEGPREGFQIEPGPIRTEDKVALVDALSDTGIRHIQVCSFVSPKLVPGWSDAEAVAGGFAPRDGVEYTALWFNEKGLNRALAFRDRLKVTGSIALAASEKFRSEEHTSELQSLMRISYAVFCWQKKKDAITDSMS